MGTSLRDYVGRVYLCMGSCDPYRIERARWCCCDSEEPYIGVVFRDLVSGELLPEYCGDGAFSTFVAIPDDYSKAKLENLIAACRASRVSDKTKSMIFDEVLSLQT